MRNLESVIAEPPITMISDSVITDYNINGGNMYGWIVICHGFWHNIGLIVPSFMFVMFLVVQAKKSFVKPGPMFASYGYGVVEVWECHLVEMANQALESAENLRRSRFPVYVDFDDKSSWEYLFKDYWLYLKEKLSLNLAELSQAKNLQKESRTMICKGQVPCFQEGTNNFKSAAVDRSSVVPQTNLSDYDAIDMHNINMIYLRRNLMENLLEDKMFHDKVVGSVVRIKILVGEQEHEIEMYRLVKVVGTIEVLVPYKVGVKTTTVMLEVLNLDKKEVVSIDTIDTISNQDFSEDECRHLKQSIECGLVKRFIVGEIQEKALALQSVKLNDRLEAETRRLNHLHDRESENGHKKEYQVIILTSWQEI